MYLGYIQLSLAYRENPEVLRMIMRKNNCTYDEARIIDCQVNWMKPVRMRFDLESRCISAMVIRLLGRYKNKNCSKIFIDCFDKDPEKNYPYYAYNSGRISEVRYELADYVSFFNKTNYEKKQIILKIIKESIYIIGKKEDWDLTSFEEVFNKIEALDYNNYWVFGRKAKSPNKLYTAELYIEHEIEDITFFVVIRNKKGDIVEKKLIIKELPSEWKFCKYFGKLVWVSDKEIHLNNKEGFKILEIHL